MGVTHAGRGEEEPLSFLQLGSMEGAVTTHQMPRSNDALSPEISIPDGLLMGHSTFYSAYVSELLIVLIVQSITLSKVLHHNYYRAGASSFEVGRP